MTAIIYILFISLASTMISAQNCGFDMDMGGINKCQVICQGRSFKCIADGVCLCKACPNSMDNSYVHTHEDVSCEFTQECSRLCMDVNSEPEYGGNIGRGKKCEFTDDNYGIRSSVCACACL